MNNYKRTIPNNKVHTGIMNQNSITKIKKDDNNYNINFVSKSIADSQLPCCCKGG